MDYQERVPLERQKGTEKMKQAFLEHERAPYPMPMPPWIPQLKEKVFQTALHFARKAYRETGRFFYIPYSYLDGLPWDEVTTNHIFSRLLQRLTIEELPDYTPENHRKAIDWWLSWQNRKTGAFHNPIYVDPQNPANVRKKDPTYEARDVNAKYLPAVLRLLGVEPLLPAQMHGTAKSGGVDYDEFWKKVIDEAYYNHAGIMVNAMLHDIAAGKTEPIPAVEFAVSYTVNRIDPDLGNLPSASRHWGTYAAMEPTLKTFGRMIGQQAVENLPPDKMKRFTDFIVAKQTAFVSRDSAGNIANTSQLYGLSLACHDYRRHEVYDALRNQLRDLTNRPHLHLDSDNEKDMGYCLSGSVWSTALLCHVTDYINIRKNGDREIRAPELGGAFAHRIVMGPYSAWANVIPKKREELAESLAWNYERHGLRFRNERHAARKIEQILPLEDRAWKLSATEPGSGWREREYDDSAWKKGAISDTSGDCVWFRTDLELPERAFSSPWLTAVWDGEYDVHLNGIPVKRIIRSWNRKCGWHLPEKVRETIRPGKNVVSAKVRRPAQRNYLRLGLINWD